MTTGIVSLTARGGDSSQRMLNALEVGIRVPIYRHLKTSETVICLEGRLDWVFYDELPNLDAGGTLRDLY